MAGNSRIEWTEMTWNPVTGCSKISPGCTNCYAERMAKRLQAMGQIRYRNGFELTLHPDILEEPYRWKKPRLVFVNSMSDLFHEDIPFDYIQQIFKVMNCNLQHTFQILTKRSSRLREYAPALEWTNNIWMGVTIERKDFQQRAVDLNTVNCAIRFLSLEPLLGPMSNLMLDGINWIVVGGESGPGSRPIQKKWVTDIRDRCVDSNIPFFFKQWGGVNKKKHGRFLDNHIWNQMPTKCNLQEYTCV